MKYYLEFSGYNTRI